MTKGGSVISFEVVFNRMQKTFGVKDRKIIEIEGQPKSLIDMCYEERGDREFLYLLDERRVYRHSLFKDKEFHVIL